MREKVFEKVMANLKNPRLYVVILILLLVVLFFFPYIDANYFYYGRVNNRIDILKKMSDLDWASISENEILKKEYQSILAEIEAQPDGSIGKVFIKETDPEVIRIKFITGGLLSWIFAVACFGIKNFKNFGHRFLAAILIAGIGFLLGVVAKEIPTIFAPMVNYIGFPFLQIIILGLAVTTSKPKSAGTKQA